MSELLLHWLNHDLQLSTVVSNVETDFASGYLLGEILERLNQQHNLSDFMDSKIADAKIINFCLLEPTLRRMNVRFDSKIATAIMNGKSGAAANLLYQIKMAAERLARAPSVSTRSEERRNVLPLHNIPPKLAKPSYDAAHHYFFEHSVRRQVKSLSGLKRERDAMEVEKQMKAVYREQQAKIKEQLEITKAERLHQAFIHSEYIKTALDETDSPAWRQALETKRERERRKATFYQQLMAAKQRNQQVHTFSLRQTVEKDLDEFERRGTGVKSPISLNGAGTKSISRKSLGYGLRSLSTTLEQQSALQGPGLRDPTKPISLGEPTIEQQNNTSTIRDQKQRRERSREQFERRRKRFLQEALHTQSHTNASHMVRDLEDLVGRVTHIENESSQAMAKILVYKEIATENRKRREKGYANRREMDHHEAIDRDTAVFELLFAKYNDDWEMQTLQKNRRLVARTSAQQHENTLVAGLVLHEIITFAMVVAAKREDSMHSRDASSFLPTEETWNELRFQFAQRGVFALDDYAQVEAREDDLLLSQLRQYLEQFVTPLFMNHDYVGAVTKGSIVSPLVPSNWKFVAAVEILEDRFVLGETIKYLRWIAHSDPPPLPEPDKPQVTDERVSSSGDGPEAGAKVDEAPQEASGVETASGEAVIEVLPELDPHPEHAPAAAETDTENITSEQEPAEALPRLCILLTGPPFGAKTTQAKLLAEKYELALLSVELLLEKALTASTELGKEAQSILERGDELPPRIYSRLVLDAIHELDRQHRHRWVLHDLPSTQVHAQSLEEHLTAFVEPAKVLSPYDYESMLAPGCAKPKLPQSFLHGKSGLDLVFYLESHESSVLERCLGTLEDRETHEQKYHLLFAPPALDAADRHRLQHVNRTSNASALLSLTCLSTEDFKDDEKKWFSRFDTLRDVATTECQPGQSVAITRALTVEAAHEQLVAHVDALFDGRRAADEATQREREREENEAMLDEESRHRKLLELKKRIRQAQEEVAMAQQAVQQAEETKAKKEELAELRAAIEPAKKLVEQALIDARDWRCDEALKVRNATSIYSARLLPSLSCVLASVWDAMENEYIQVMKHCLRMQRQQRERVEQRVLWLVATICRIMRRADAKQAIVDTFQTQFNTVIEEMRFEDATKSELHARADVLQDELCLTTATKQRESEDELREIMADGWLEDTCQWIALIYQRALQAECDRFRVTLQLLLDAFLAASDEPAQLAGVVEVLKTNNQLLNELTLKTFVDVTEEHAVAAAVAVANPTVTPAAAGKAGAKAPPKGKPPLVPQPSTQVEAPDAVADPFATETLLLTYDHVVEKSETLLQLIVNAPPKHDDVKPPEPAAAAPAPTGKTGGKTGTTPAATPTATPVSSMVLLPRQTIDVATSNFQKAVKYEHDLLVRRVRFLKNALQSACEHVERAMRAVEAKLRGTIEQRAIREEAAVACLVEHVRTAIEAETNLPFYISIQPEQVYRFPTTEHLIEDTRVTVNTRLRLVPRAPVDPPPEIESSDIAVLNSRQAQELRVALALSEVYDDPSTMTTVEVVAVLHTLATEPHALPMMWQQADEAKLVHIIATFADAESGLVDTRALVDAMETGDPSVMAKLQQPRVSQQEPQHEAVIDADAESACATDAWS